MHNEDIFLRGRGSEGKIDVFIFSCEAGSNQDLSIDISYKIGGMCKGE